jgi:hypothetical protein
VSGRRRRRGGLRRQQAGDRRFPIEFGGTDGAARAQSQPRGRAPEGVRVLVVHEWCVPAGPARKDTDRAGPVVQHEADAALLVQSATAAFVVDLDGGVVVDARRALERRDEADLGRLDATMQTDLTGRHRGDGRRGHVGDARRSAVAREPTPQHHQPDDQPDEREGDEGGRRERSHGSILRAGWVASCGLSSRHAPVLASGSPVHGGMRRYP